MKNYRRGKLPRKIKKAMDGLLIDPDTGKCFFNGWFRYRGYPRTRSVLRAERQFKRKWREHRMAKARIEALEAAKTVMAESVGELKERLSV